LTLSWPSFASWLLWCKKLPPLPAPTMSYCLTTCPKTMGPSDQGLKPLKP
jgi:hypothetical protein